MNNSAPLNYGDHVNNLAGVRSHIREVVMCLGSTVRSFVAEFMDVWF